MLVICDYCNRSFNKIPSEVGKRNYCKVECYGKDKKEICKGENNSFYGKKHSQATKDKISLANKGRKHGPSWNAGLSMYKKELPRRVTINGKRMRLSRHVWLVNHLGEIISKSQVIHHIDLNPYNNDISNLVRMDGIEHRTLHVQIMKKMVNRTK